ncbi:unnamed protein product [Danaus chrysippus]|uniref:(African queen) hypothetical protein n=1 Tax=Danaus chrysippus TaxID=151541 RepID=A0A8J2QGA3_9NEOP|nr:unnamed protein product [Danaus chrysippus]
MEINSLIIPEKPLLMLQSIKCAWRLDPSHEHLHDCLLRFRSWLDEKYDSLVQSVASVIDTEMQPFRWLA